MLILVGYASTHGATGEIAERIAEILTSAGQHAEARPVQQAGDLGGYEGFVVGTDAKRVDLRMTAEPKET
jgi:menaquinone-dependent protoporphyrinogen oxidase